jgi:hypothetical protein
MVKKSIGARMFGWILRCIFPKNDDAWFKKFRRRIYYPTLNSWGDYNQYAVLDTWGNNVKITMTGFITWRARGYGHWLYNATGLAPLVCKHRGHKLVDCSSAGPDGGDMDHCCDRCDQQWSVTLY